MNTRVGQGLAAGLLVAIAGAAALVVRDTLGAIASVPAMSLMEQWQQAALEAEAAAVAVAEEAATDSPPTLDTIAPLATVTYTPSENDWQLARSSLDNALQLAPDNPELHANLGRLYQFRFENNNLPLDTISESAGHAAAAFQRAAQLRPTWPYHWWDVARTEYVLQRAPGPAFRQALDNVVRFGPWLEDVQLFATDLALEHWPALDASSHQLALQNIDRALQRNPDIVSAMLASYAAWSEVCSSGERQDAALDHLRDYCQSPELRAGISAPPPAG
ncbi:hypothetical protein [Parahaliea aestuarii]|uniref:Tetratricopeptide repeat protein n=1 Tax=Parahaliea aestuarii TaxID=1852021 RepID=A0A5C8ZT30_9GAMM|nr:hypothetical protein [Parahaliea aestuarii]TXS90471.1 hypothetical protein FVW59_14105 [Parahaliea aestuarii]